MAKNKLFTIGHSTHDKGHFIKLLKMHSINLVCDVRSQPYSRYCSHFNKETLEESLKEQGIVYLFLGRELGGRSEGSSYYVNGKLNYEFLSRSPLFQEGVNQLVKMAKNFKTVIMCSEADPLICHRTVLLCWELCQKGLFLKEDIYHILPLSSLKSHREMERILLERLKISPDMLRSEEDCIQEAYRRQAQKIAYQQKEDKQESDLLKEIKENVYR